MTHLWKNNSTCLNTSSPTGRCQGLDFPLYFPPFWLSSRGLHFFCPRVTHRRLGMAADGPSQPDGTPGQGLPVTVPGFSHVLQVYRCSLLASLWLQMRNERPDESGSLVLSLDSRTRPFPGRIPTAQPPWVLGQVFCLGWKQR